MAFKKKAKPEVVEDTAVPMAQGTPMGARPSTDANIVIQLLVGLVGTLIVSLGVLPLKKTGVAALVYINAVINERGPVQYGELFMAFMMATMLILKSRIIKTQLQSIAEGPVDPNTDLTDDEQVAALRKNLVTRESFATSILLNRIDRLLALWLGSKDIGRVAGWLGAESARDSSAADSSYANARVLIWAIPILGFIGTVLGLGAAVAGFSEFLAGAADLGAIKTAIGNVTSGLGTAFDTTLLALVLSVFLMFSFAAIQRKEEMLFVEIDIYLDDTLLSRLPSAEQQPIVIENLEDSIEAAFRRYIPDPDRYDEVFSRSIEKAAGTVEERFSGLTQKYEATLKDLTGRLADSMASVGSSIEGAIRTALTDMQQQDAQLIASRKQIAQEETDRLRQMMTEVQQGAAKVSQDYQRGIEAMQGQARDAVEKSMGAAKDLAQRMAEVATLASGIERLLHVNQAVDKSLATLATSEDFTRTLVELRNHLATTDAFCDRLSQPRTIMLEEEFA